jgi:predicted TIM-barrel fold metal-dependent hydrolase
VNYLVIDSNTHFGLMPYKDTDVSVEKLVSSMRKNGVAGALTYSLMGVAYDFQEGNEETSTACSANPGLLPVATVDPRRYLGVIEEIGRCRSRGFVALRVFPEQQGWKINSALFGPILNECERVRMPLIVSAAAGLTDILQAVNGSTVPLIVTGIGYANLAEGIAVAEEHPSMLIEVQVMDPPDSLRVAVDALGAERFVFGSNAPSLSMRASLNLVAESELSDEQKALVFGGNLQRVLGLSVPDVRLSLDEPFAGIPTIDVHSHYGKWPFPMRRWGVDYTIEIMRKRRINRTIMSSSYAIVYDFIEGNRQMAEAIEGRRELLGYVTVNPNYFEASCGELETYLRKPNFVGAKIHPAYCRLGINTPKMRSLLREIEKYRKPVLIHTFGPGTPSQIQDVARDCPNLPFIMGHGGADAWREAADVISAMDNVYMEFCCSAHETDKVRRTVELAGADRVLFGTDLDLIHPGFVAGVYEEAGLGRDDLEKILYRNAVSIFGIEP